MSWRASEEGTYWIRLKSSSCPISKHRQQQMFGSTSVSHAQKQRKVLTNMRESAWLPRSFKKEKKQHTTTQTQKSHLLAKTAILPNLQSHFYLQTGLISGKVVLGTSCPSPRQPRTAGSGSAPGPRFGWTAHLPPPADGQHLPTSSLHWEPCMLWHC